ncbi:helix-turn-helix transcriptional regulator [Sulfitobacter sp. R18_1]|uniref:helix-turn-helix domain-containing protein n=1 Tax=Sulfitobacter sp. R18_1 TaxID=2821104 RepID=UPI001ADA403B|nr:helix-turn-helix transcriptional regulator [Sulfitobacter sp. R18_1]MBO9428197.1 helix-turn-helix transcriptional regulator [Sulfitobacter sp. R18_1]
MSKREVKVVTGRYADIAHRLRAVRAYYDLGSAEYAEQANVSPKSYSQWESGDFRVSVDGAIRLHERYGISLDYIYLGVLDALPHKISAFLPALKGGMRF